MGKVINLFNDKGGKLMNGEVTVFDVAKAFLAIESMTHKKLQKLCYYAQAWHIALFDKPLFGESFEAWIHGPVCPELYSEYKSNGWNDIPKLESIPSIIESDQEKMELINQIYRIYGGLDGDQLERLTHSERPWIEARKDLKPWEPSQNPIDHNIMKKFYLDIFEKSQND